MALNKMGSVSCRIKEVTQISVSVYFLKFRVVQPYLSLHVATFPGIPLQYQQSIIDVQSWNSLQCLASAAL